MKSYSTDEHNPISFRPHGRVDFQVIDEGIVVYRAIGPFNLELMQALESIEAPALKRFRRDLKHWCEVVKFEHSCMALDDAMDLYSGYIKDVAEAGMTPYASAFVYPKGIEGAAIMKDRYRSCMEGGGIQYAAFENEADAITWAKNQLDYAKARKH